MVDEVHQSTAAAALDRLPEAVYVLDDGWTCTYLNDRAATSLAVTDDAVLGKTVWEPLPETTARVFRDRLAAAVDDGATVRFEGTDPLTGMRGFVDAVPTDDGVVVHVQTERGTDDDRDVERRQRVDQLRDEYATMVDITTVVQKIDGQLVHAETVREISSLVCERLADASPYQAAWFHGTGDADRVARGVDEATLEEVLSRERESVEPLPGPKASRRGTVQVVQQLAGTGASWATPLAEAGIGSCIAVPVTADGTTYGVLTVCSQRPSAFGGAERDVLTRLGETVSYHCAAAENERHYRSLVEGTFDHLPVGGMLVDADSRVALVNRSLVELLDVDRELLLDARISTVVDRVLTDVFDCPDGVDQLIDGSATDGSPRKLLVDTGTGTADQVVEYRASEIVSGTFAGGVIHLFYDVTDWVHGEHANDGRPVVSEPGTLASQFRPITTSVIRADTEARVYRAICEGLADVDGLPSVWVGEVDVDAGIVVHRASTGDDSSTVEDITLDQDDTPHGRSFVGSVVQSGEVNVCPDVFDDPAVSTWCDRAEVVGSRSIAGVPIVDGGSTLGVVVVHGATPDHFDDHERRVLASLGSVAGYTLGVINDRAMLEGEERRRLRFRLPFDEDSHWNSESLGANISLDRTIPLDDGAVLLYVTVEGMEAEAFERLLDDQSIEHVRAFDTDHGPLRYEVRQEPTPLFESVMSLGGVIESVSIESNGYLVEFDVPKNVSIRTMTERIQSHVDEVDLVAQRTVDRQESGPRTTYGMTDALTEKQLAALEAAYHAGYFEWSRDSNGTEIAASLGISASTFHEHLRAAQRKLTSQILGSADL